MDRYAVVGNPVAHSLSPRIHSRFAEQTGHPLRYDAVLVEHGDFVAAVERLRADGVRGLNVTVPFKQEAWALAAQRSPRAERAGAVNTLVLDAPEGIYGDNTDGAGLLRDLSANHGVQIEGRDVLVLGAGGAVRGVLQPLMEAKPRALTIANRTAQRAVALAEDFADLGPVTGVGLEALAGQRFDRVINGTAAGLGDEVPDLPAELLGEGACCYDMMYGSEPTAFVRWAREQGAPCALDGLGMLVEQAAESFQLWRGVRPDTGPVIAELRP